MVVGLASNPGGRRPGRDHQRPLLSGLASFSGLTLNEAGQDYSLLVASGGLASVTTPEFDVTSAAAAQLVVTSPPPATVPAGQTFGITVAVEDQYGNVVTGYSGNLAVAPTNSMVEGSLGGTLTVPVINGVATFAGLSLVDAGTPFTLQVSTTGLPSATTSPFTVTAATAAQLVVTSPPPTNVSAGVGFGLVVAAEDQYGNVVSDFSGSVTLALTTDPSNDTLVGNKTEPFSGGLATFAGLTLDKAGPGYVLQATSSGPTPPASTTLALGVTAGPPSQLVLTSPPPATVTAGVAFGLVLAAEDPYGNVDPAFAGSVTVALASNPGGSTLGGATSVSFINGLAIFAGLTLNEPGQGYTFVAVGNGLTSSPSLNALTLSVTPRRRDATGDHLLAAGRTHRRPVIRADRRGRECLGQCGHILRRQRGRGPGQQPRRGHPGRDHRRDARERRGESLRADAGPGRLGLHAPGGFGRPGPQALRASASRRRPPRSSW